MSGAQPEQQLERLAEDLVVLDEDDPDRLGHRRARLLGGQEQRVVRLAALVHVQLELRMPLGQLVEQAVQRRRALAA